MTAVWRKISERVDAMMLRERALIFAAIALLGVLLPYALLVAPQFTTQKSALARIHRDQSQLDSARREIEKLLSAGEDHAIGGERTKLQEVEARTARAEATIAAKRKQLVPPQRVPEMLRDVISRNPRITLVSLDVVPGAPLNAVSPKPAAAAAPAASTVPKVAASVAKPGPIAREAALYRHGVEVTVRGDYFGLMDYVAELEKLPWALIWGELLLEVQAHPEISLRLKLYTLSEERAPIGL